MKSVSITVKGVVQGVYYRQSSRQKATSLGIGGEVKNLEDGDVHIIATGSEAQLEEFISWCHEGPRSAIVTGVIVKEIPLQSFSSFRIAR